MLEYNVLHDEGSRMEGYLSMYSLYYVLFYLKTEVGLVF